MKPIAIALLLLFFGNIVDAQQVIGAFPQMDGGFEAQNSGSLISTASSSTPDGSFWSRGGTSGSGNAAIDSANARSGAKYITVINTKNNINTSPRTYLSPASPVISGTSYVIQFYAKATDGINFPNTTIQVGLSSATGTTASYKTFTPTGNPAIFTKYYLIDTSNALTNNNGFGAVKISSNTANLGYALDIDDWVVYLGTDADTIAPINPGPAMVNNPTGTTLDASWTASSDVDSGGYLVIRYTVNPTNEPNPNVNGIYKVGNTIGSGVVAYVGTTTMFTDVQLSNNTTYYYRVYSVDKAFNYSNYVAASGTTVSGGGSSSVTKYYIDSLAGNDNNNGSIATPWKNVSKLNNMTLTAGTEVYLKCGSRWSGQKLKFNGSGTSGNPIKISSYGTGAKPLLAGNGIVGEGVVYLYNQQYIEISNLEITNSPRGPINSDFFVGLFDNGNNPFGADRRGVMVAIDDYGTANHIYLKNLYIHHIKGQLGNGETAVNGAVPKRTGGIFFTVLGNSESSSSKSRFNDVLIDSSTIAYCENIGIALDNEWNVYYPGGTEYNNWFNRRFTNIKISNDTIHHIGKNAMIIRCTDETGLIERNVCYETALGTTGNTMFTARAKGTVFQYNEGYNNRATTQNVDPGNIDGSMYDPDYGSIGVIFQYSYSHDNSEGIYWGCNTRSLDNNNSGTPDVQDTGCTLRYCISQNDKGRLLFFNYASAGNEIYNNVFYTKSSLSPTIISENDSKDHKYNFFNNIVYCLGNASYSWGSGSGTQTRKFSNNIFYGDHPNDEPSDSFKVTTNPKFVNPGSGVSNSLLLDGYKLQLTSPAFNSGRIIANNGGFDFYGTPLPATAPNRGVYQRNDATFSIETVQACSSYTWHGTTYTTSTNTPVWQTTNAAGFDSTVTLHLTIVQPSTTIETVRACSAYVWHGITYTVSTNTATWQGTNQFGCDSTVTLHLTLNALPINTTETIQACSSYVWHDSTYSASTNTATWTTNTSNGCDSMVTLHLTISTQPKYFTETVEACSNYLWHGTTYTVSTNAATWTTMASTGCDSIVTLNLNILQPSSSIDSIVASSSYSWHGTTYTVSTNTPVWIGTNIAGCDSLVTLHLTLTNPTSNVSDDIYIAPNPAIESTNIYSSKVIPENRSTWLRAIVFNSIGKKVKDQIIYQPVSNFAIQNLSQGMYYIRLHEYRSGKFVTGLPFIKINK